MGIIKHVIMICKGKRGSDKSMFYTLPRVSCNHDGAGKDCCRKTGAAGAAGERGGAAHEKRGGEAKSSRGGERREKEGRKKGAIG